MANYSIYLESLQALSAAIKSAMSLIEVRQEILHQYSLLPSAPTDSNQTVFLDAIFEILPKIEELRNKEKMCRKDYSDQINKSFQNALDYILSLDDADISVHSISGFIRHLNLVSNIIEDRKKKGEEALSYDKVEYSLVLKKLDSFTEVEQAKALKQAFQQIIDITE